MTDPAPTAGRRKPTRALAGGHLSSRLDDLLNASRTTGYRVRDLFDSLAGRGHAALLVVIALPFSLPLPLFGLSTVFGIILAFIGLRIAFARRPWLPRWIMEKPVQAGTLEGLARRTARLERALNRVLRPRFSWLCRHPVLHRAHGVTVAVLAVLLALPLPIPLTNIITAVPILMIGLSLLEDDGAFLTVAYACAIASVAAFVVLFWAGGIGVEHLYQELEGTAG